MHDEARRFLDYVFAVMFPSLGGSGHMLDCGSGDINGNNRCYVKGASYVGNDIAPGPNVDIVCETGRLEYADGFFDCVVSSECFEHDAKYADSLRNIHRMLKPGGVLVFTCASIGRHEHGTLRTSPSDSFSTRTGDRTWATYYKNLVLDDIAKVLDLKDYAFRAYYNGITRDLYFVGIRDPSKDLSMYTFWDRGVTEITHGFPEHVYREALDRERRINRPIDD